MSFEAAHLDWLEQTDTLTSACGQSIPVFTLKYDALDSGVMTAWAKHFRNHYCRDEQLELLRMV